MPINPSDIQCVLSGGTYNSDPDKSLGDNPSLRAIWGMTNNLFSDVTAAAAEEGNIDFRCFYIVNNSENDTFFDTRIYLEQEDSHSIMEIGIAKETDIQQIVISGIAEGGSYSIKYENSTISIEWRLQLLDWGQALQDALNSIEGLGGIVVNSSSYRNEGSTRDLTRVFEINFTGASNYRYHPMLELISNDIVGSPVISINKKKNGCPINSIAAKIDVDIIEPYGITWSSPTAEDPLLIGNLRGGDSFPVWIKRTVEVGALPRVADGFLLKILGKPYS